MLNESRWNSCHRTRVYILTTNIQSYHRPTIIIIVEMHACRDHFQSLLVRVTSSRRRVSSSAGSCWQARVRSMLGCFSPGLSPKVVLVDNLL